MRRRRFSDGPDPAETHHAVVSDILHALGKGMLIGTAGVVAGAMLGTAHLATLGLLMLGVSASCGVGLVVGAALVRRAGCDHGENENDERRRPAKVLALVPGLSMVIEARAATPETCAGFAAAIERQRQQMSADKDR